MLVQHCTNNSEYSTCYLRQYRVVVSQQCHRIASFLRLVLSQISGTVFHCYLGNAVLVLHPRRVWHSFTIEMIPSYQFPTGKYPTNPTYTPINPTFHKLLLRQPPVILRLFVRNDPVDSSQLQLHQKLLVTAVQIDTPALQHRGIPLHDLCDG